MRVARCRVRTLVIGRVIGGTLVAVEAVRYHTAMGCLSRGRGYDS